MATGQGDNLLRKSVIPVPAFARTGCGNPYFLFLSSIRALRVKTTNLLKVIKNSLTLKVVIMYTTENYVLRIGVM